MALVMVHSLRGGVGTTFLVANLAIGLAKAGKSVAVLDFSQRSTLGLHFGLTPNVRIPTLDDPALSKDSAYGVMLLQASASAGSSALFDGLAQGHFGFDGEMLFLADMGTADETLLESVRTHAALELCVLTPSAEALSDVPSLVATSGPDRVYAVNKVDDTRSFGRHAASLLRELLGGQLVGAIRSDEAVVEAVAMMQPVVRHAPASAAARDINRMCAVIAELAEARTTPVHSDEVIRQARRRIAS